MKKIILTTFFSIFLFGTALQAQNLNKVYGAMDEGDWEVALELLEPIIRKKPKNYEAKMLAAICHSERYRHEEAITLFKESAEMGRETPYYYIKFAKAYLLNEQIDEAEQVIKQVRMQDLDDFMRPEYLQVSSYIQNAKIYMPNPADIIIKNLGPNINSGGNEYSQVVTQDQRGIYFTARREGYAKKGDDGEPLEQVLTSEMDDLDKWKKDSPLEGFQGAAGANEAPIQLLDDDQTLITFVDEDLFIYSKNEQGRWRKEGFPFNSKRWDSHAFIYNKGNSMIFASDVDHEVENLDLYIVHKDANGRWGKPSPIQELNTSVNDDSPFVAEDGTLYFSSRGHDSMGGYDIFKTRYDSAAGQFMEPENMGAPINLTNDDTFFTLYGKNAYLSSSRPGGYGQVDIYRIIMFDESQVQGLLIDCDGEMPISNATISVVGREDQFSATSNEYGVYKMKMPIEQQFKLRIEKNGEVLYEEDQTVSVLFRDEFDINQNFYVGGCKPNEGVLYLKLINTFDLDPGDLPVDPVDISGIVPVTEPEPKPEPDPTPEVVPDPEPEKEQPEEPAKKPDPEPVTDEKVSAQGPPVVAPPADEFELPNVYFDFDKHNIKSEFFQRLDEAAELLKSNTNLRVMVAGHTDAYGTNPYNVALGQRRYTEVYNYLINKGVNPDQLEVSTFSEDRPVQSNHTIRGRAFNRRVELYLIEEQE